ncbi:MAG: 3-deoxy-D-manno-octulosonic acid transferase, partial [Bacteroidia bacterium]
LMLILYNLAILLYSLGIRLAALFGNTKASLWIEGRKNWRQKIKSKLKSGERRIWFHCSSVGEFEQGRPLIEALRVRHPEFKIVLTFFSPSGYELRKNYEGADYIFYLPADTRNNARDFISIIQPEKTFFIKYDYWLHYISELNRKKIPLYIVSGVFRPSQLFFKWYGTIFRKILFKVHHFFLQDKSSASLLQSIGINNFSITGDTRFDRVIQIASEAKAIEKVQQFKNGKEIFVAGSTWHEDNLLLVDVIKELKDRLKIIIVPHEIGHRHIGELEYLLIEKAGLKPDDISIYTDEKESFAAAKVLIVDTVGLLSSVYRYGEIAYVGGGFGKGIHNILEAAVYGMPVFFGPAYEKFNEAQELIDAGAAYSIKSSAQLTNHLQVFLGKKEEHQKSSVAAKTYISKNGGATRKILDYLAKK